MNTKYVFLDIDGTLVDGNGVVPESAAEAIMKARKNGHKIFICSGRSRGEMHDNIMSVPLDGIIGSGSICGDGRGDYIPSSHDTGDE